MANLITACDIGTSSVRTVVVEKRKGEENLRVVGVGVSPSHGLRRGVVVEIQEASEAIQNSIKEAEKSSGVPIKDIYVGAGGAGVSVSNTRGVVAVSRADQEISSEDRARAVHAAESFVPKNQNKEILHLIPRDYKVDSEGGIKDPVGMHGIRLEVDTLVVESAASFLKNMRKAVETAGFRIKDHVFAPLGASDTVLSKQQKELGTMLIDIGGGTTSFMVWEEGTPLHAGVIPFGGLHITNDIAIGLRTKIDTAEELKQKFGTCLTDSLSKKEMIEVAGILPSEDLELKEDGMVKKRTVKNKEEGYSKYELSQIITARLGDIIELLDKELKKINRAQLLPGGIVLIGGSSHLQGVDEFVKKELKLPAEKGVLTEISGLDESIMPDFAVATGIAKLQMENTEGQANLWEGGRNMPSVWRWIQSLLP